MLNGSLFHVHSSSDQSGRASGLFTTPRLIPSKDHFVHLLDAQGAWEAFYAGSPAALARTQKALRPQP